MINLYKRAYREIENGNINQAIKISEIIRKSSDDKLQKARMLSNLYIDIGSIIKNEQKVRDGIDIIQKIINYETEIFNKVNSSSYYNLANGYLALFNIKRDSDEYYNYMNKDSEDREALKYYHKALTCNKSDKHLRLQIYINIGNILSVMGRSIEALEYYNQALKIDSNFGMALANKGLCLKHYAYLTGDNWYVYFKKAHDLIKQGLYYGVNNESIINLQKTKKWLEDKIKDIDISGSHFKNKINYDSEFDEFLYKFCNKHRLYLNLCDECQKCNHALNDDIIIKKMTVDIKVKSNEVLFLQLSSFLNEIKQNYVAARFLLAQSRYDVLDLSFVDKNVAMVNTLNYIENNIYIQLLKFSFKNMFDILDKIAIFINKYLSLNKNERYVDFNNIWYNKQKTKIHNKILEAKSINLNALLNLSLDLTQGELKILSDIRNALTHRFLNVYMFGNDDLQQMNEECLLEHTINISKVVKSAIIYLLSFVDEIENKKEKEIKEKGNEIIVPFRINI